jgi:hypothetical protein
MKYIFLGAIIISFNAFSQTPGPEPRGMGNHPSVQSEETTTRGTQPLGTRTLGHPTYPTGGQTRNRSNDMTGEDMSNASKMGSDRDPRVEQPNIDKFGYDESNVEEAKPADTDEKKEIGDVFRTGPYKDGKYTPDEEGPEAIEAQEEAQDGFQISDEVQDAKQEGK